MSESERPATGASGGDEWERFSKWARDVHDSHDLFCDLQVKCFVCEGIARLAALAAENARLREALEHYADEANWGCDSPWHGREPHGDGCFDVYDGSEGNGYDIARETLGLMEDKSNG